MRKKLKIKIPGARTRARELFFSPGAQLRFHSERRLAHIAAKSHVTLWFPGGGFLWVDLVVPRI